MRGEGFISERWFTRHQLLQKINDVARPDLRQISGFQCASCLTGTDRPKAILDRLSMARFLAQSLGGNGCLLSSVTGRHTNTVFRRAISRFEHRLEVRNDLTSAILVHLLEYGL